MTPQSQSVLVLGAGELGMAVLRGLTRQIVDHPGITVSVLLRPATIESAEGAKRRDMAAVRAMNVSMIPGDVAASSVEELAALFQPYDTVISCTGFVGGHGTQVKLARAALHAGVKRYLPWQFGVDYDVIGRGSAQDLFDEQLEVRELLRGQNATEWVIVSTGMFTSFLFEPSFGVVDLPSMTVRALGSWENAVTVTTAEDIGVLTAEIVFAQPRIANAVVYTAGDTVTYRHLADLVDSVLGQKVRREIWSVAYLREELAREPDDALRKYRVVFAEGKGVSWERTKTFNAARGIATVGVEAWMRESFRV